MTRKKGKAFNALDWPEAVWVANPTNFVFDGPPGFTPPDRFPQSMTGWVDHELNNHLSSIHLCSYPLEDYRDMYQYWMDAWHKLFPTYFHNLPLSRITRKKKQELPEFPNRNVGLSEKGFPGYSRYDLYNATWASLGYVQDQSPRALQLLSLSKK